MTTDTLILVDDPCPGVRRLTLNRPDKRNALSNLLRGELFARLREADLDRSVRVIVVRGAGTCFSAGYDLGEDTRKNMPRHAPPADGSWPRHLVEGWFELMDYATPIIAQVHGWCLAGGTELAAACDLVYAAEDAQFGYPPVRIISPPDMVWHPWLMGMRRAMEAMLTGDSMSGTEAVAAGIANRAFPADKLEEEVLAMASRIAQIPGELLAMNKRVVHRSMEVMGMRTAMRANTETQALGMHQKHTREYYAKLAADLKGAFSERDKPFGDYRESTAKA